MKHTKGEWVYFNGSISAVEDRKERRLIPVAKIDSHPQRPTESEANAKLIAAAPEMLDFLIGVSKLNQSAREHINEHFFIELELIIKKATE